MADEARARLDALRTELGQIDKDILALVAKRQAVAQRIGQVKRGKGVSLVGGDGKPVKIDGRGYDHFSAP